MAYYKPSSFSIFSLQVKRLGILPKCYTPRKVQAGHIYLTWSRPLNWTIKTIHNQLRIKYYYQ